MRAHQGAYFHLQLIFLLSVSNLLLAHTAKPRPSILGQTTGIQSMKKLQCIVCGFIYDEAEGLPDEGIQPGTAWDDVPDDWVCPDCGVSKGDFEMVETD